MDRLVLESCHCTWVFDSRRMRFRRVLQVERREVATEWRPYHRVDLDSRTGAFTVVLDARGARLLRSWRHDGHCSLCSVDRDRALADRTPRPWRENLQLPPGDAQPSVVNL